MMSFSRRKQSTRDFEKADQAAGSYAFFHCTFLLQSSPKYSFHNA